MHIYILTEVRNFKIFLKESHAITGQLLLICEKNIEQRIEYDVESAYVASIHSTFLNFQ